MHITSQWQDPETSIFAISVCYVKLGHMLEPIVPKFRYDLSVRLRYIAEKQVPAKPKPIIGRYALFEALRNLLWQVTSSFEDILLSIRASSRRK